MKAGYTLRKNIKIKQKLTMSYSKIKVSIAFLIAVIVTFILASIFHSQFVIYELTAIGIEVPFTTRIRSTLSDLIGLAPGYGPIILIGMLIGFSIIGLSRKRLNWPAVIAYPIGGFVSIVAIHLLMYPIFYITLIAGARSNLGLAFQCLAGAIGGFMFARLLVWAKNE